MTLEQAEAVERRIREITSERMRPGYDLPSGLALHVDGVVQVRSRRSHPTHAVAIWTGEADEWLVARDGDTAGVRRRHVDGTLAQEEHSADFDPLLGWTTGSTRCPEWVSRLANRIWPEGRWPTWPRPIRPASRRRSLKDTFQAER